MNYIYENYKTFKLTVFMLYLTQLKIKVGQVLVDSHFVLRSEPILAK